MATDLQKLREFSRQAVHPCILFSERVAATAAPVHIESQDLKASRDMLVDYIAISEESFSRNVARVGAGQTYLHYLDVRWQVIERAGWLPGNSYGVIEAFHNVGADRSAGGIMAFANRLAAWGELRYNHPQSWVYNPLDTLTVDLSRPANPAALSNVAETLVVFFDGVGKTGLRRSFQIQGITIPAALVAAAPWALPFSDNQRAANLGAEPFFMTSMGMLFTNRNAVEGNWNADLRLLNHFRMRVTPSIGDSWSQVPIPLAFYGVHMGAPHRVAYHRPVGGPIPLAKGQSITFDAINNSGAATNIQVALIGRIAPGYGAVE